MSVQEDLAQSLGTIQLNLVRVYKALGGGWACQGYVAETEVDNLLDINIEDIMPAQDDADPDSRTMEFGPTEFAPGETNTWNATDDPVTPPEQLDIPLNLADPPTLELDPE